MIHETGDKLIGHTRQTERIGFIVKGVFAVLHQRDIRVHARAAFAEQRFRQKRCIQPVAVRGGFDHVFEGHHVVGGAQHFVVFEVDLVLGAGVFVVRRFDFEAHVFEREADFVAAVLAAVGRAQLKIAAHVVGLDGRFAVFVQPEEEEFALGAHVDRVAHVGRFLDRAAQNIARITLQRCAVGAVDVADQPGGLALFAPRQNRERIEIRVQTHVALFNAHKAVDGGAVKAAAVVQRLLQLAGCDGHAFEHAEDVGELQQNKLDVFFFCDADDVFFGISAHTLTPHLWIPAKPGIVKYSMCGDICQQKTCRLFVHLVDKFLKKLFFLKTRRNFTIIIESGTTPCERLHTMGGFLYV